MNTEGYNKELCCERHERIDSLLEKQSEQIDSLEKCTIKLTQMIERHDLLCEENEKKVNSIMNKPAYIIGNIIGYALSAGIGAVAAHFLQNYTMT